MIRFISYFFLLLPLVLLPGCGALIYGATEVSSLSTTGKLASDHLISFVTGNDCSLIRYQKTGHYCLTPAEIAEEAAKDRNNQPYCYRQLAGVVCYQKPDPAASTRTE